MDNAEFMQNAEIQYIHNRSTSSTCHSINMYNFITLSMNTIDTPKGTIAN